MESQLAELVHSTVNYSEDLWLSCEYSLKAHERTGARTGVDLYDFNHRLSHKHEIEKVVLHDLMPYLDDYMNAHDRFVEDFIWSMDESRHTKSTSKELPETDVPRLLLFFRQGCHSSRQD